MSDADIVVKKLDLEKSKEILKPLTWGYRLIRGVFNKDYSLKDKIKFTTETVGVSQEINDLIN